MSKFKLNLKVNYDNGNIEYIYNEYDNAYYMGNLRNPYLILVEAKNKDITSCVINDKTKIIYSRAFSGCSKLTSVTIPDSVTYIGDYAFYGCNNLKTISVPNKNLISDTTFICCDKNLKIIDRSERVVNEKS